jgi:Ser/Thr protein kinase RdoA (MazF antagonist)
VYAFLRYLEAAAPGAAPRVLGAEGGRETLSFVPGDVPDDGRTAEVSEAAVASTGRLLRRVHGAARGFRLPEEVSWHHAPSLPSAAAVVCHNDVAPRNVVFSGHEAVALIDWDFAGPEDPLWDLAHAAWQFAPLMPDDACRERGWRDGPPDRGRRLTALLDGYGASAADRAEVLRLVPRRVAATLHGIERGAAAGDPAASRLVAGGVTAELRRTLDWLAEHPPPPAPS